MLPEPGTQAAPRPWWDAGHPCSGHAKDELPAPRGWEQAGAGGRGAVPAKAAASPIQASPSFKGSLPSSSLSSLQNLRQLITGGDFSPHFLSSPEKHKNSPSSPPASHRCAGSSSLPLPLFLPEAITAQHEAGDRQLRPHPRPLPACHSLGKTLAGKIFFFSDYRVEIVFLLDNPFRAADLEVSAGPSPRSRWPAQPVVKHRIIIRKN